jgi:thioredoxin 1
MKNHILTLAFLLLPICFVTTSYAEDSTTGDAVLLDFYSGWCGPCQTMMPTIDAIAAEGFAVKRIDVDCEPDLARQHNVRSLPCFVVLESGREIDRVTGVATAERLKWKMKSKSVTKEKRVRSPAAIAPQPRPAWRYEEAVGPRAAVVRIYCQDAATTRSIGSGTLVRWNNRIVVLTARHVVKGAKSIVVELLTKRTHRAKIVAVDAVWDCAVLELAGEPVGVSPVDVALGEDAIQHEGNRLESCGYGPDGRLACNSGLFLGYRRSTETPQGPDDWFIISGHARSGDSGGPLFNDRGQLVGVLWGTDGQTVVCVQAGRLHRLLDAAAPEPKSLVVDTAATLQRNPTPPKPCPPSADCCPASAMVADETSSYGNKQHLKWRNGSQDKDAATDARIEALIAIQERQAKMPPTEPKMTPSPAPANQAIKPQEQEKASPVVAAFCIVGAIAAAAAMYFLATKEQ